MPTFASDKQKERTMRRYILTLIAALTTLASAQAMSYERAREEAAYLTDKMAYELNLNDQQYNDAYEINLDYFLSMDSERDLYQDYLSYRLTDLRHILMSWQFDLMLQADYFVRPLLWQRGCWVFPIYGHYHRDVFFYDRPRVFFEYRGGHSHHHFHNGFYAERRPHWDGGMRGREPMGGPGRPSGRPNPGRGEGYHFDLPSRGNQRPGRDNQPSRGDAGYRDGRGNQPSQGEYNRGYTRGDANTGRGGTEYTRRDGYTRGTQDRYTRQGQGTGTRSYDRSTATPSRSTNAGTHQGYGTPTTGRGNSFTRSSSRATTGTGGYSTPSRGAGVSRGSSTTPSRGGSMGTPTRGGGTPSRGGAQGGGAVSRGRR